MTVVVTGAGQVIGNLRKYVEALEKAMAAAGDEIAEFLKSWTIANHTFQNRTGDTEASIDAAVIERTAQEIVISLWAGMPYDVFVELARNGEWAFLWPAVVNNRAEILAIIQKHGLEAGLSGGLSTGEKITAPMGSVMAADNDEGDNL